MGRIDDAMRRAAAERAGPDPAPAERGQGAVSGPTLGPAETFPTETPDRGKLHPFPPTPAPVEPARPASPGTGRSEVSLIERIDTSLAQKVVVDRNTDPVSREQYRKLAATLHAAQAESGLKVVMIASALAGEGKTLTAANLALTFSESYNRHVLVIDADLRKPSMHTVFGLPASPGLTDGLSTAETRLTIHRVSNQLAVLPAGNPSSDPMGTLASERMSKVIEEARHRFDWVIIDTPPVGVLPDARLLTAAADGAVLVVRAESTPYDLVELAVESLGRQKVLGVVLNRASVDLKAEGYKYGHYYHTDSMSAAGRK